MRSSLDQFVATVRSAWSPLTSDVVCAARNGLEALARAPGQEAWLADLLAEAPASEELHRDQDLGFVLLAHTESQGLYRPPHDHGRAWVVYAVPHGEVEMRTYARIESGEGQVRLVQRDARIMRAGDAQAYLPGDIHDTRCLSASALLFRFTERDLRHEGVEGRLTRYPAPRDGWTSGQ
ncbi:hypothetical protein [Phenylobacterium sp.]|uniref:hypothetical protein n=1 Tax=Phenylobacterium sp. TaxID=1871053 RepID=UPI002B5E86EB|nr:hypothetical protein [Phenylobacterium sp.]HVI33770.1 hypothetical protein [Phenylobacterium sp.]